MLISMRMIANLTIDMVINCLMQALMRVMFFQKISIWK
jgi:hypothetical protein